MDLLLGLATQGLGYTLFVISALVNVYLYRLLNTTQEKRLADWQTALNLANNLATANQKIQESVVIMIQGIDKSIQRLLDKEDIT